MKKYTCHVLHKSKFSLCQQIEVLIGYLCTSMQNKNHYFVTLWSEKLKLSTDWVVRTVYFEKSSKILVQKYQKIINKCFFLTFSSLNLTTYYYQDKGCLFKMLLCNKLPTCPLCKLIFHPKILFCQNYTCKCILNFYEQYKFWKINQKNVLSFRKSALRGGYKPRNVTNQDMLLFEN